MRSRPSACGTASGSRSSPFPAIRSGERRPASSSQARGPSGTNSPTSRWSSSVAVDLRLGIDVGGTNTDAVVLDREDRLLAKAKVPTTPDVTAGIRAAIDGVVTAGEFDLARITHVMLGTTHATNAVLQRRDLR